MPRKIINVPNHTYLNIAKATSPGHTFRSEGNQLPDGTWDVPVGEDVFERLEKIKMEGETHGDTIDRLLAEWSFENEDGKHRSKHIN